MAVSLLTCAILIYGIPILGVILQSIYFMFIHPTELHFQSNSPTITDESLVEGMMWFDLGQTD